jgi:protein-L-isoaspartate O-methyltransferase
VTVPTTEQGVRALVAELDLAGKLPAGFGPLLEAVPREKFIPDRVWVGREPLQRATQPVEWFQAVYADRTIVTQYDDGRTTWPSAGDLPTCSASQPSVVVGMLEELDLAEGQSVLEVGTGTGFNAALLRQVVGAEGSVTTVEVDKQLAKLAEERLIATGYRDVEVIAQDATVGQVKTADQFDRIIATMAVPLGRIPYSWVEQTRAGGFILAPVRADLANGPLVRFTVHGDGTATGRTLPMGVAFMDSRSQRAPMTPDNVPDWEHASAEFESVTEIVPWPFLGTPSSRWALAVAMPSCRYKIEPSTPERNYKLAWLHDPVSGSWASLVPLGEGKYLVRQIGIRRLWDEAEAVHRWWTAKGEPFITDWVWTITPDEQSISVP